MAAFILTVQSSSKLVLKLRGHLVLSLDLVQVSVLQQVWLT